MRIGKQESEARTNYESRQGMAVRAVQTPTGERRPAAVQVLGFTDPVDAEAALQRGETLTAFWDGKQVVWK
jgi:hypothetical protein